MLVIHSSGDIGTANPTFYHEDSVYYENITFEDSYYRLYGISSYYGSEAGEIPGDWVNIPEVHNISPFVSYDNNQLYFPSDRPGGYGGFDIWQTAQALPESIFALRWPPLQM